MDKETVPWVPCVHCNGAGMLSVDRKFDTLVPCGHCSGSGRVKDINKALEELSEQVALETTVTTPLWLPLYIYEKAEASCYTGYMKGFKALIKYFSPIAYPTYGTLSIPYILGGYELQEVARHLNIDQEVVYTCMVKEVIPRLTGVLAYNE